MTSWVLNEREKWVAQEFEVALEILKRLPQVKVRGFVTLWPEISYSEREIRRQEALSRPCRLGVSRVDLARLARIQRWIILAPSNTRKILWLRAAKYSWRSIGKTMFVTKDTARKLWIYGINEILRNTKRESVVHGCPSNAF